MRPLRTIAITLFALAVLSSCATIAPGSTGGGTTGGTTSGGSTPPPVGSPGRATFVAAPGQPTVPNGVLLGLSSYPDGYGSIPQRQTFWQQRNAEIGRPYDVANFFYNWGLQFPTVEQTQAIAAGSTPMISWNGTDTNAIINGSQDALIRNRAQGLKGLNVPVFLRFFWEMDGHKGASLAGGNPANFIAAWRYVHNIFDQEGVTNVSWVWAPTNLRFGVSNNTAPNWYPGDDVVDWIGCDGYNWAPVYNGYPYDQFQSIFGDFYKWAGTRNKPIMIAETGAMERNSGEKSTWMRNMVTTLKTTYTNIRAVVYYDVSWSDGKYNFPFKIDTAPDTLATWQSIAADPFLNTRNR